MKYIIDINVSNLYLTKALSEQINDLSLSLLCDSKIVTNDISAFEELSVHNVIEESAVVQYSIVHNVSLIVTSNSPTPSEFLKNGILSIAQKIDGAESKCLCYGRISFQETEESSGNLIRIHLTDNAAKIAVVDCTYTSTAIDNSEYDLISESTDAEIDDVDAIDELKCYFDISSIANQGSTQTPVQIYASLFALLLIASQNTRTQLGLIRDENSALQSENKELLRYKVLCESLKDRQKELTMEVAKYRLNNGYDDTANSRRHNGSGDADIKRLKAELGEEKAVASSLRKELSSCVSREELFTMQQTLNLAQLRLKEMEQMNDRLVTGLAEVALANSRSNSESDIDDARNMVTTALLAGSKSKTVIIHEANQLTELIYQKDALFRNNQILSHQVLTLINQLQALSAREDKGNSADATADAADDATNEIWNKSFDTQHLSKSEVDAGIIHSSAGPTSAAQFAIIADLERSLMYCKQVIAEQTARLEGMELASSGRPLDPPSAAVVKVAEVDAEDAGVTPSNAAEYVNIITSLEEELEESKKLATLYYERLQAGAEAVKRLNEEHQEAHQQANDEIENLNLQISLLKSQESTDVSATALSNVPPQLELEKTINDLELELEESKNLANLYYEKLQAGAEYMKAQKEEHDAKIAELATELAILQQSDSAKSGGDFAALESELEESRSLANLYYEKLQAGAEYIKKQQAEYDDKIGSLEEQVQRLAHAVPIAALVGAAASNRSAGEGELDEMDRLALESELEESRNLANLYYEKLQAGAEFIKSQKIEHERELAELEDQLMAALANNTSLQNSLGKSTNSDDSVETEAAAVGSRAVSADNEISELQNKLLQAEEQIIDLTETCDIYQERLKSAAAGGDHTKGMSEQLVSLRDENTALANKAEKLQDEVNTLLIQISALQFIVEDSESKLSSATKEYNASMDEMKKELENSNMKVMVLQNSINGLQDQLSSNSNGSAASLASASAAASVNGADDVDKLIKKITQLESELNFERNRCEVLEEDLLKLSFNPEGLKEAASNDSGQYVDKIESLERGISQLETQLESQERLVEQLRDQLKKADNELERKNAQFKSQGKQLEENKSSNDHDAESILQELITYKMNVALISAEMEDEKMKNKNLTIQLQKERATVESLRKK